MQGPALLGALWATAHHPCVWAAGRRAAAVGSAKGYGDLRRTPRLATVERPREYHKGTARAWCSSLPAALPLCALDPSWRCRRGACPG
jgi:hypothetical protein